MIDLWQQYLGLHPELVLLVVFIFDLPRDFFSYLSVAFSRLTERGDSVELPTSSLAVIVCAYNAEKTLRQTLESLAVQSVRLERVIVVCDGSTDQTWSVMLDCHTDGLIDLLISNPLRLGVAASCNKALLFADSEHILFIDSDTMLMPDACQELQRKMASRDYAAVSGNIGIRNASASIWTALQKLEYMFAVDFGRSFMDKLNAISCLSGALTICRRDALQSVGGFSPGSGQDLELTLRFRRAGYRVGFASRAWAYTHAPETGADLIMQRLRWNRDAMRIHIFQYMQLHKASPKESLGNTLQRYDFVAFVLTPTLLLLVLPFTLMGLHGDELQTFVVGTYLMLTGVAFLNLTFGFLAYRGSASPFSLLLLPIVPLYIGIFLKTVRLYAFLSEALWHASRYDNFVPARIRKVLYKR